MMDDLMIMDLILTIHCQSPQFTAQNSLAEVMSGVGWCPVVSGGVWDSLAFSHFPLGLEPLPWPGAAALKSPSGP